MIKMGTKAETLERLTSMLKSAKVLPQLRFTHREYIEDQEYTLLPFDKINWLNHPVIVRSSTKAEDHVRHSMAGHYTSILSVKGRKEILTAIERVISSFDGVNDQDQVLIQPMLSEVVLSGVVFSKNPTSGAPYILINYDDHSGSTSSVTSGVTNDLKAYCHYRYSSILPPDPLDKVVSLVVELEALLQMNNLDIEFAITQSGELFVFQVRPLVMAQASSVVFSELTLSLQKIAQKIQKSYGPHPYLHGSRTIYGIMPDWNPAEIVGVRPKPLALSLYKEIITDHIWAYQRDP